MAPLQSEPGSRRTRRVAHCPTSRRLVLSAIGRLLWCPSRAIPGVNPRDWPAGMPGVRTVVRLTGGGIA